MRTPRRTVTLQTAPATEPITLDEAKAWARIDGTDDDTTITALITAVRVAAEQYLRRSLITQSHKLTLDLPGCAGGAWWDGVQDGAISSLYGGLPQSVELPKGPVSAITSVTTYALDDTSSTFASSNYRIDTAGERLVLTYGSLWPSNMRPIAACEIIYVAGYGAATTVPAPIKNGMLIHLASLYEQRGQCDDAMDIPPGAKQLYNPYRIMDYRG